MVLAVPLLAGCGDKPEKVSLGGGGAKHDHTWWARLFDDREHKACQVKDRSLAPAAVLAAANDDVRKGFQAYISAMPEIVAAIDGQPIPRTDLGFELLRRAPDGLPDKPADRSKTLADSLETLIDHGLVIRALAAEKVPGVDDETNKAVQCQRDNRQNDDAFAKTLGREGHSPTSYRRKVYVEAGLAALLKKRGGVNVTDADVRAAWEKRPDAYIDTDGTAKAFEDVKLFVRERLVAQRTEEEGRRLLEQYKREVDVLVAPEVAALLQAR